MAKKVTKSRTKQTTAKRVRDRAGLDALPRETREYLRRRANGEKLEASLDNMLPGGEWASVRTELRRNQLAVYKDAHGRENILAADFDANGKLMNLAAAIPRNPSGKLMNLAAAIPRNPGKAYNFLQQVEDFNTIITADPTNRKDAIALFHRLYRNDGMTNNAINKLAALVAPEGSFKVRSVKGQRGKAGDKVAEELVTALNWWKDNVNARGEESVITGDRGITSFIVRGARLGMIEGDCIARHHWPKGKTKIPGTTLAISLPMNLQVFSAQHIEIPDGLEGTNYELLYWVPPKNFINLLKNPKDPNLKKVLDKTIPSDVKAALLKDGQYLLDPALLIHIKNKGTGIDTFGESTIEPTLGDIRYKRALDALEITTITNLINRLVIVKVGSDNEKSVYHSAEVSSSRLALLQRMMRNVGPSSVVLWGGPDLEVVEVGAHDSILALDDRYRIAERRHLMSLGLPAVLMIGEGTDGKAAGFAAALGVAAQLGELQNQFAQAMKSIAERIATDNGYDDVDVIWEFTDNLLEDKERAAEMILKMFDRGLASTKTAMEELGFDHDAERVRQAEDVENGYKDEEFGPPKALVAKKAVGGTKPGSGGGGDGRPPGGGNQPDPRKNKEKKTKKENS